MVCDEVMAGFGRTGKLFGFCHAPSVVPDIVTFAKVGPNYCEAFDEVAVIVVT